MRSISAIPGDRARHAQDQVFLSRRPPFASQRGITLLGPKKIFDQTLVHLAWLYADRSGHGSALIDLAYPRFFKRELDYEDRGAVVAC